MVYHLVIQVKVAFIVQRKEIQKSLV
ncbi:hypothetical protein Gohar_015765 [Gossypium harknessii]|uniref:NERD domain-containing protein n=1 Tax=Gossypium harknessii TaxID=34285 RepID=A0A7J9G0R3_9ROSI|nr:hypothetical protein [Gossypium harknessii]